MVFIRYEVVRLTKIELNHINFKKYPKEIWGIFFQKHLEFTLKLQNFIPETRKINNQYIMSTHCGRYPACGCSKEIGNYCHLSEEDLKSLNEKKGLPSDSSAPKEAKPETPVIPMILSPEEQAKIKSPAQPSLSEAEKKKQDDKLMQGIYKMCSLAMLQQSMILFEGFTKTHASNVGTDLYNERIKLYKQKGFRDALQRAAKESVAKEKNVLKSTESIRNKAAEIISQTMIQLNETAREDFEKFSRSVGEAALMMMHMDDPRKAKVLIKMYNDGMFKGVFETIEQIEKEKENEATNMSNENKDANNEHSAEQN